MIIAGRTQLIVADSYGEAVRKLAAKGFEGIEIGIYDRDFHPRERFYEEDFPDEMLKTFEECGIKSWSVGAHMDYAKNEENFKYVSDAIGIAKKLGTDIIIVTGALKNDEEPFDAQFRRQVEAMKRLCEKAEKEEVYLALEYEPGFVIDNSELMLRAFSEVDSKMLRVNADIGHFFLQEKDPLKALEDVGDLIIHAHIENMAKGVHNHLVPYEGDMDLKAYFRKLRDVGFDGQAAFDAYQYDYEAVAESSVQYFRKILAEI